MIGKINRSSDFGQTLRYVSREDELEPLFGSTYAANRGLGSDAIAAEMDSLAERSRSQRPCLHASLSPEKEDSLSEMEWAEVAALWTKGMGLESNQYAVYLHHDEDYGEGKQERPHAHIVANLVGEDGRQVYSAKDYYRSQLVIRDIEQSMDLEQRQSSWEQTKKHEQQQRFTEGDRELSTGQSPQQQPTGSPDRGGVAQTSGGNLQVEQNRRREGQQSTLRIRANSSMVDTRDGAHQRDRNLGNADLVARESEADRQSGNSAGADRAESRDVTQQQRVEEIAPLFKQELLHSKALIREGSKTALKGRKHTVIWDADSSRLAVIENESRDFVMLAERDRQNRWHDKGSKLTAEHCDRFKQALEKQQAKRHRQRAQKRQQKPKQKELTL